MKKILFIAVLAVASLAAYAQPRAIGGRVGAFEGFSYQHSIGEKNMIELEFGYLVGGINSFMVHDKIENLTAHYSLHGGNLQLAATFDWIDPFNTKFPWEHKGEWHWYMGVGAAGGYGWTFDYLAYSVDGEKYTGSWASFKQDYTAEGIAFPSTNWGFVGAVGRIGVEYDFWFPLQLSIDWRPTMGVGLIGNKVLAPENKDVRAAFYWEMHDIALGVRYKF